MRVYQIRKANRASRPDVATRADVGPKTRHTHTLVDYFAIRKAVPEDQTRKNSQRVVVG